MSMIFRPWWSSGVTQGVAARPAVDDLVQRHGLMAVRELDGVLRQDAEL